MPISGRLPMCIGWNLSSACCGSSLAAWPAIAGTARAEATAPANCLRFMLVLRGEGRSDGAQRGTPPQGRLAEGSATGRDGLLQAGTLAALGLRPVHQGLEGRVGTVVGVGTAEEALAGVVAQVDAAQFPDELLDVEVGPEVPQLDGPAGEAFQHAPPLGLNLDDLVADGAFDVVELEHRGGRRTSAGQPCAGAQPNQLRTRASRRGRPSGSAMAGSITTGAATRAISSSRLICTSSLERKWAKTPLLDMPTCSASTPSVTPDMPSRLIRASPSWRSRSRVSWSFFPMEENSTTGRDAPRGSRTVVLF